jgi:uncharacterized RDD family membrane protein YckC
MNPALGLLRRTLAAMLDILLVFVSGFVILTSVIAPIYTLAVPEFVINQETLQDYQLASFIYYENEEGGVLTYSPDDYSDYFGEYDYSEAVYDYYALFKNNKTYPTSSQPFLFSISWFNETILKVDETNALFELNEFDDLTVLATPKSSVTEDALKTFYFQAYIDANNDLLTYPPFQEVRDELNWVRIQILILSITLTVGIFYFVIPLWLGNGQTLIKRLFNIVVVNKSGFKLTNSELFLRFIGTWISFVALAFTVDGTLLVVYAVMAFSPFNRAPHDFFAMTKVIDGRGNRVFKNETERENSEKSAAILSDIK